MHAFALLPPCAAIVLAGTGRSVAVTVSWLDVAHLAAGQAVLYIDASVKKAVSGQI